jgi:hypothetical protein
MKLRGFMLALIVVMIFGACRTLTPNPPTVESNPTSTLVSESASAETSTAVPSPIPTLPTSMASPVPSVEIQILGDENFIILTRDALALLEKFAPDAYAKTLAYVGVIEQTDITGMWAYEDPPRYAVSDTTAYASLTWYASTIAHDATHSELYHTYLADHPGSRVPDDIWTGIEVERFCNSYQLDVLHRIGGPEHEIEHLSAQTGDHCDVDQDGDCDWDDYEARDW